jgi:hypothetical protein
MTLDPGITKKEVEGRARKLLILWWKGRDSNPRSTPVDSATC